MPTRLVHLVVDAAEPSRLAAFWAAALGWEVAADEPDEAVAWPAGFDYPGIAALPLVFVPVSEPKTSKNRVHLDLASASADDQADTIRRLRDLGATPADIGQGDVPWVVLADPEGNELCVLDPRPTYRGTGPVAAVVVDCADPGGLARFWADAAGWRAQGSERNMSSLRSASGAGPFLELVRVPGTTKTGKNRIHLDVAPLPGGDNRAEAARLRVAGARPADVGQGAVTWVVLADPEGNEFCVLTPR
jgi:predicted enzyme related to lactoylglutathione lyase